ncbi:MAG: VWA domain-containing protein [Anaerolineaceae bacterium]|nr:VWA domain-containing protein [Anaerolineaceae bacterium]
MSSKARLTLQVKLDLDIIARQIPTQRILELSLLAPAAAVRQGRSRLNLALVLDRSGSMSGEKLEYVKKAASHLVGVLQEGDRVAVIAYDSEVSVLSPSVMMTPSIQVGLQQKIAALDAGNMTYLSGGWLQGCQEVAQSVEENQLNRVLLLTDGLANEGITDLEELGSHARQLSARGVSTSTFGVGEGFNEHLLEHMANQGGGAFYYIASPHEIPDIFLRELNEMVAITARQAEISIQVPAAVSVQVLGDWRIDQNGGRAGQQRILLGDLAAGHRQEVFVKLLTPPSSEVENISILVSARAVDETGKLQECRKEVTLTYQPQDQVQQAEPDREVLGRYSEVEMATITNRALKLERDGLREEASQAVVMGIAANAPYMSAENSSKYEQLSNRMKEGMDESERKINHYESYLNRKRRN